MAVEPVYFLHPCARLSAEWLHDKHSLKMIQETERLLATACQMIICDIDDRLPKPDLSHPFLPWATESVYNAQWLLSHYTALIAKSSLVFHREYRDWKLQLVFNEYVKLFPRANFTEPPKLVPEDCLCATADETYRRFYLRCRIGIGSYKRVRIPFWVKDHYDAHQ